MAVNAMDKLNFLSFMLINSLLETNRSRVLSIECKSFLQSLTITSDLGPNPNISTIALSVASWSLQLWLYRLQPTRVSEVCYLYHNDAVMTQ